jgi:hypothetical protein
MSATLLAKGNLSLNRPAHEGIGEARAVQLLYDPDERIVGLRPVEPGTPDSYDVRMKGANRNISFSGFAKHWGIDTSTSRRYRAEMIDGVLAIDLKQEAGEVNPRNRPTPRHQLALPA